MARTPNPMTVLDAEPVIDAAEGAAIEQNLAQGGEVLAAKTLFHKLVTGDAGETLKAAGGILALNAVATVADSMALSLFEKIKETKAYRFLPDDNGCDVATLERFCEVYLGRSYRRMHEIAANRRLLGEDLYEAAEQMGLRERDYRLIRALPDDDREAVRTAIADAKRTGDDDAALAVLAEFAARQREARTTAEAARERAEVERDSALADYRAASKLAGEARTKLRQMETGDRPVPQIDEQMANWPKASGFLIGECRANLTRIGLMIEEAERRIQDANPVEGSPAVEVVSRACTTWYNGLSADLNQLRQDIMVVEGHLDRMVGAFADVPREPLGAD